MPIISIRSAAYTAADNVRNRVSKAHKAGKPIPCLPRAELACVIAGVWPRDGRCSNPHCGRELDAGRGVAEAHSPSIHKVVPARGYVAGNIRVICNACNTTIGEAGTIEATEAAIAALQWQLSLLRGE